MDNVEPGTSKRLRLTDDGKPEEKPGTGLSAMREDSFVARLRKVKLLQNVPYCFLSQVKVVWLVKRGIDTGMPKIDVAYIVTMNDQVYVLGNDPSGATGLNQAMTADMGLKKSIYLSGNGIKGLQAGWIQSVAWTDDGRLILWAANQITRSMGVRLADVFPAVPTQVTGEIQNEKVLCASSGMQHNVCCTQSGKVYAWGCNGCYQVTSTTEPVISNPKRVQFPSSFTKPVAVACSAYASFVLTEDGKVFSWGSWARGGERGVREHISVQTPIEEAIPGNEKIKKIVAGRRHILALSVDGHLFAWGSNDSGEIGNGTTDNVVLPSLISFDQEVLDIGARERISVCRTATTVYVWGKGEGRLATMTTRPIPTEYETIEDAQMDLGAVMLEIRSPRVQVKREDDIRSYCNSSILKDVTFEVGGQQILASRVFLNRCERFQSMLSGNWKENADGVIIINDFGYEEFRAFIKFLHTDEIDIADEFLIGFLELADYYLMDFLREKIMDRLKQVVSCTNAVQLYSAAHRFHAPDLGVAVLEFIKMNFRNVMHSTSMDGVTGDIALQMLKDLKALGAFSPQAAPSAPQPDNLVNPGGYFQEVVLPGQVIPAGQGRLVNAGNQHHFFREGVQVQMRRVEGPAGAAPANVRQYIVQNPIPAQPPNPNQVFWD